jgi:hypothetical protein
MDQRAAVLICVNFARTEKKNLSLFFFIKKRQTHDSMTITHCLKSDNQKQSFCSDTEEAEEKSNSDAMLCCLCT